MLAVESGHCAMAKLLIDHGADLHAMDEVIESGSWDQLFEY